MNGLEWSRLNVALQAKRDAYDLMVHSYGKVTWEKYASVAKALHLTDDDDWKNVYQAGTFPVSAIAPAHVPLIPLTQRPRGLPGRVTMDAPRFTNNSDQGERDASGFQARYPGLSVPGILEYYSAFNQRLESYQSITQDLDAATVESNALTRIWTPHSPPHSPPAPVPAPSSAAGSRYHAGSVVLRAQGDVAGRAAAVAFINNPIASRLRAGARLAAANYAWARLLGLHADVPRTIGEPSYDVQLTADLLPAFHAGFTAHSPPYIAGYSVAFTETIVNYYDVS